MIGRDNDVLSKGTVMLLSIEDCERRTRVLVNNTTAVNDRVLCSAAAGPVALVDLVRNFTPFLLFVFRMLSLANKYFV